MPTLYSRPRVCAITSIIYKPFSRCAHWRGETQKRAGIAICPTPCITPMHPHLASFQMDCRCNASHSKKWTWNEKFWGVAPILLTSISISELLPRWAANFARFTIRKPSICHRNTWSATPSASSPPKHCRRCFSNLNPGARSKRPFFSNAL